MKWYLGRAFKSSILALSIVLLSACNATQNNTSNDAITFGFDDFETVAVDKLSKELISDDVAFGRGAFIKVVNDSIIAVRLIRSMEQVILHNLNNGTNQTGVMTGNGPHEILRVATMSVTPDNELMLVGSADKKVMTVKWNDNGNIATTKPELTSPIDLINGVSGVSGKVIALPTYHNNARACIIERNDSSVTTFGEFPTVEMPDSVTANNSIFQSDIAYSWQNDCAIVSNKSWNIIEIYNLKDGISKTLVGPDDIQSRIIAKEASGGVYYQQDPTWLYYNCVCAGPETFAVGYIGAKIEKREDFNKNINRILEFDYSGKPLKCYSFDNEILAFDIDYNNQAIYTIEIQEEPVIMRYNLND